MKAFELGKKINKLNLSSEENEQILFKLNNEIGDSSSLDGSLSNSVYKVGEHVVKLTDGGVSSQSKVLNEFRYFNMIGNDSALIENGIVFKYVDGKNLKLEDVNERMLESLKVAIEKINEITDNSKLSNFKKNDLVEFYKKSKLMIESELCKWNLSNDHLHKAIDFYSNFKLKLTHGDLNNGNIIINDGNVVLIDFENISYTQWIYDYVTFFVNWDLNIKDMNYLLRIINADFSLKQMLPSLIVYGILIYKWNNDKYFSSGSDRNKKRMSEIEKRINWLIENIGDRYDE